MPGVQSLRDEIARDGRSAPGPGVPTVVAMPAAGGLFFLRKSGPARTLRGSPFIEGSGPLQADPPRPFPFLKRRFTPLYKGTNDQEPAMLPFKTILPPT